MIVPNPTGAATNQGNLLQPFAWALFRLRVALDEAPDGRPPRWVRIARGREIKKDAALFSAIQAAVATLVDFIAALHRLILDLEALLLHIDPEKALIELLLELGKAATAPQLGNALAKLLDDPEIAKSFATANAAIQAPDRILDYIPEPGDVAVVGRQIFELLCFDAYPGDGVANVWVTGRVRLLAWAYGLPVMVWPRPLQRTAEAKEVRVARIGLRQRGLRAAAEPTQCRGTWSVAGRPREIFLLDVSKGQDLDEVVALLDALGYTQPAVEPGQTGVGGPLTVRLRVFQHMNDLPPTGDLDPDTLFRLLHLDLAQRNIAAPRPFDPARWAAIAPAPPPREETRTVERIENILVLHTLPETPLDHGDIPLVNPDADQYAAEGIRLVTHPGPIRTGQKKACTYYICAAKMGAEEAIFPSDIKKGWIPHQADDDWLFQEKEKRPPALGCSFVGLASRAPLAGDKTGFEGGELSEGAAFQPGRDGQSFFFSAREVEPWIAGRNGHPGDDRLFANPPWPAGSVSGMYQWAPLGTILQETPSNKRLYVQASYAQRSLYKERGQGHTPDQGRIVLGLVAAGAIPERQRYSARFKAKHLLSWAWSAWWPHKLQADLEGSQTAFQRGSQWVHIASPGLLVPQDTVGIFVGVYGKHNANYDTDAYFDNIRVQWWRELIPGSGT